LQELAYAVGDFQFHWYQPEVVIDAIRDVWKQVRRE
jgi:hypothetical protein